MKENKLVNILVDFAFKRVFAGEEESRIILKDFFNSILELKGKDKISEITYLNPFNDRKYENDKQSIMDIRVKNEKDELIDIEVQINRLDDFRKRTLYYWSKLYGETILKGKSYYELKKSIVINIVDFTLIEENSRYHNVFEIKERQDKFKFIDDLQIHYIELSKFNSCKNIDELNDLEDWITFLKECGPDGDSEIIKKLSKKKDEINEAFKIVNKLSADKIFYQEYLAREKYLMDEMSKKRYAELKMKEVKEEAKRAKEEGKSEILITLLIKKFKKLPNGYKEKIEKLPEESLEEIANDIFDLNSVEELEQYF